MYGSSKWINAGQMTGEPKATGYQDVRRDMIYVLCFLRCVDQPYNT